MGLGDGSMLELLVVGDLTTWWLRERGGLREVSEQRAMKLQAATRPGPTRPRTP